MKKILLLLALVISAMTMTAQEFAKVNTKDGKVISGYFVKGTKSEFILKITDQYLINKYGNDTIIFNMSDIKSVYMYGKTFVPASDGLESKRKSTSGGVEYSTIVANQKQPSAVYSAQPSDPNLVIGKALKTAGGVSLGIGIPSLMAGTACLIAGYTMDIRYTYDLLISTRLKIAGEILFPIGASLTIVGIPLHVHGKKIMNMDLNYTGNGLGIAMCF